MKTFLRGDIDPLEVSSERAYAELATLAERAFQADADTAAMVSAAMDASEVGDTFAVKQFMNTAQKRDKLRAVLCQLLGLKLANAGYEVDSPVAVGRIAVSLCECGVADILGIVSDVPPEALAAIDAALEGDSDPDWSDRDEMNQRMYEYSQMISHN